MRVPERAWPLLPPLAAILAYLPTLRGELVWDDTVYLNRWIAAGDSLREIFLPDPTAFDVPYYRPIANLAGYALYAGAGENAALWHAFNVVLHAATTLAVFFLMR